MAFVLIKIVLKKDCSAKCTFLQRRYRDGIWGVSTEERECCEAKKVLYFRMGKRLYILMNEDTNIRILWK